MNAVLEQEFDFEEDGETELLEAITGMSMLEEDEEDNGEMLRVLERQESTLQVQLENLLDSLEEWERQAPAADSLEYTEWRVHRSRLEARCESLAQRIRELEGQISVLEG